MPMLLPAHAGPAGYAALLGWPLARGRCYRAGTCACRPACATPDVRPVAGVPAPPPAEAECTDVPGDAVIAPTLAFDAVIVGRAAGMQALVWLDRLPVPVPCLTTPHTAVFLVAPGTAGRVGRRAGVEVRTGPAGWIALPPTGGVAWDTPPWDVATGRPLPLPHADEITDPLADALAWAAESR
jgi:hypothetical protein